MPGGFVLNRGGWREHTIACNVFGVKVTAFRANHDWHVAHSNARFGRGGYAVALDGEVDGHRRHVGQLAETTFHRR